MVAVVSSIVPFLHNDDWATPLVSPDRMLLWQKNSSKIIENKKGRSNKAILIAFHDGDGIGANAEFCHHDFPSSHAE